MVSEVVFAALLAIGGDVDATIELILNRGLRRLDQEFLGDTLVGRVMGVGKDAWRCYPDLPASSAKLPTSI